MATWNLSGHPNSCERQLKSQGREAAILTVPDRNQIKIGSRVLIEAKQNQGTGRLIEGIVKEILTRAELHPHGMLVSLEGGQIGRVKKMSKKQFEINLKDGISISDQLDFQITHAPNTSKQSAVSSFVDLHKKKMPKTEDTQNEFKETFQYDRKMANYAGNKQAIESMKYDGSVELAKAICSFGNSYSGGFVYLGVAKNGDIVGLEDDRRFGNFVDYDDEFANHIVTRLKELIRDNIFIIDKIKIVFRQVDDKTVCLVQVLPAALPLYLHRNKIKEFYVRGSAPRAERLDGLDQARYIQKRFPDLS